MIHRLQKEQIKTRLNRGKAIILLGARQTGKTTMLKSLMADFENSLWLNADESDVRVMFSDASSTRLRTLFGGHTLVIIDEAQGITDIGLKLKLITDQIPEVQLIATGSSAFELANQANEPLTGRKWEYQLYPLSYQEMRGHNGLLEERRLLPHRMVFGYYPDVVTSPGEERDILQQLIQSYLYKDVLMLAGIKKPDGLVKLLQALAFQVGSQVSYSELGRMTGLDGATVERYIVLLEQAFVIFRLGSFSRNLRNELKKSNKIYFWDNGVRNALISNYNLLELRQDVGALWENFIISERLKYCHYQNIWSNKYFWRTHEQQEIDYIEERDGKLFAYEFKWSQLRKKYRFSKTFLNAYPENETAIITPENFEGFITPPLE